MNAASESYLLQLSENLYLYRDTCNVYVLRDKQQAVLIDFGSGDVLDALPRIGVTGVTAVLMTHHHRDQGQGLIRAVRAGIPIYVPHAEQDLFHSVHHFWQARQIFNNYNMRQDRFSLLEPAPVTGLLRDYQVWRSGDLSITVLPTPGHTPGSISLLVDLDGKRLAFTSDLIFAPGKVWDLSATQWSYNGAEGAPATIASLLDLKERQPDRLLPSHGEPMANPNEAIDALVSKLGRLLLSRRQNPRLFLLRDQPYEVITPHLLMHRASMANTYVLLSGTGKALLIDFGYDFTTGLAAGEDRASRRPWLYTIPALKRQYGLSKIDVVIPTHYHDDHVAGINLLRDVEGTQSWVAENFADILESPATYDLPCLWYDPIPVDRRLPLNEPFQWEEYTLTLYPLPGHTLYAVAIFLEVDGKRVMATGDQYQNEDGLGLNYVYQNGYEPGDYSESARLYRRLHPDLIISGHGKPLWVTDEYLDTIVEQADAFEDLHRSLMPEDVHLRSNGFMAHITPYQAEGNALQTLSFEVEVHNPFPTPQQMEIKIVTPDGWQPVDLSESYFLEKIQKIPFTVTLPPIPGEYRARIAADITIGKQKFGQQAEALLSIKEGAAISYPAADAPAALAPSVPAHGEPDITMIKAAINDHDLTMAEQ